MSDNRNISVIIDGIVMEFEAWQFIRLFFEDDSIRFIDPGEKIENFIPCGLIILKVEETENSWFCSASYFDHIENNSELDKACSFKLKPLYSSEKTVLHEDLHKPGGSVLKSRKILAGACLLEILTKLTGKELPYGSLTGVRPVKLAFKCIEDGLNKTDSIRQLTVASGMSEQKAELLFDVAAVEEPHIKYDKKMIHLYIGIPFCASRCLYCSFTAYPIKKYQSLVPLYLDALEKEIDFASEWINKNSLTIGSVYIGGGTPTSIDAVSLNRLLDTINKRFDRTGKEFSVEAGRPDTIDQDKLDVMLRQQVTRISINPQTMNMETLRLIGRNHTPEDIEEKFDMARRAGFNNINMDIIAGLPKEDESMFLNTLDRIEKMLPESMTVHTMALKRASILHEDMTSYSVTPDIVVETMIDHSRHSALKMGMKPYYLYRQKNILANLENTGYSKPGFECIYNIHSMEEDQTILAMGAGTASKFIFPDKKKKIEHVYNLKEVTLYIDQIDEMIKRKKGMFEIY